MNEISLSRFPCLQVMLEQPLIATLQRTARRQVYAFKVIWYTVAKVDPNNFIDLGWNLINLVKAAAALLVKQIWLWCDIREFWYCTFSPKTRCDGRGAKQKIILDILYPQSFLDFKIHRQSFPISATKDFKNGSNGYVSRLRCPRRLVSRNHGRYLIRFQRNIFDVSTDCIFFRWHQSCGIWRTGKK